MGITCRPTGKLKSIFAKAKTKEEREAEEKKKALAKKAKQE